MIALTSQTVKPGDRVELIAMDCDPDPILPGTQGTIVSVYEQEGWSQIDVNWDNGRSLMLVSPPDRFRVLEKSNP